MSQQYGKKVRYLTLSFPREAHVPGHPGPVPRRPSFQILHVLPLLDFHVSLQGGDVVLKISLRNGVAGRAPDAILPSTHGFDPSAFHVPTLTNSCGAPRKGSKGIPEVHNCIRAGPPAGRGEHWEAEDTPRVRYITEPSTRFRRTDDTSSRRRKECLCWEPRKHRFWVLRQPPEARQIDKSEEGLLVP